jgi:hypothetical protein
MLLLSLEFSTFKRAKTIQNFGKFKMLWEKPPSDTQTDLLIFSAFGPPDLP